MRLPGKMGLLLLMFFCTAAVFLAPIRVRAEGLVSIDTDKKYEGMKTSFAKGYMPTIQKNTMKLVVPFTTKMPLADESLLVGVSFEREENSPFVFRNYQKRVKKSGAGVYLYKCKIKLQKNRVNGQYPLHLTVQAQAGEELIRQEFTIYVEISDGKAAYTEENSGEDKPLPQESGMEAQTDESKEEVNHQPRILITQNSLQSTAVQAGSSTAWTLSAKNCSNSQSIENVKVTLLFEGNEVSFEKTAWYFQRIAAGGSMDLSQNITAAGKAAQGQVSFQLQFEYEDNKGNAYSSAETVRFSIRQVQQAELVNLNFPESIYEADTDVLTFQVQNTGLAVIYNARVRLEAIGLFPEKEMFLGNIEAGTSADGEISVFAGTLDMDDEGNTSEASPKYGDTTGTVIFSYENEQGETTEQTLSFHTAIKKPEIVELKVEKQEEKTNQWWITILFFVFLTLILIIIWLFLRMKYYQRMRMEAYERTKYL